MEHIGNDNIHQLRTPSFVTKDGMASDIMRIDDALAAVQDKLESWKTDIEEFLSSTPNTASGIAKKVEAEHLLKEVGEVEEEVYILLDELDTEHRMVDQTSKLPTKAEWSTFLNRPATAIEPLIARLESRISTWRSMPGQ